MSKERSILYYLTLITTALTLLVSISSIAFQTIYTERINRITKYELIGQDVVTVIISVFFLLIILYKDFRKIKTKIIWLGCILYTFYIYAYFSFGGITSAFYLLYIAITGLSFFLFIFIVLEIIKKNQFPSIKETYPRKSISIFLFLSIVLMILIEVKELVEKTIILDEKLNPFYVFYVIDLSMIFPMIIITSILNIKKAAWGYLLCGVALIKIVTILPAVIFNDVFHKIFIGYFLDFSFDVIATIITLTAIIFLILYFKSIDDVNNNCTPPNRPPRQ